MIELLGPAVVVKSRGGQVPSNGRQRVLRRFCRPTLLVFFVNRNLVKRDRGPWEVLGSQA